MGVSWVRSGAIHTEGMQNRPEVRFCEELAARARPGAREFEVRPIPKTRSVVV